jgi:hypothetical protein
MEYVADNGIIDLAATLEEDIRSANRELPAFWQLSGVRIQTDDFERTSLKKIKRLKITGEEMRYAGEN